MYYLNLDILDDILSNKAEPTLSADNIASSLQTQRKFNPKIDISEDEKNIYIEVEIPGASKEDLKVKLENNILSLNGTKRQPKSESNKTYFVKQRDFGEFSLTFKLESEFDPDSVQAELENGIFKLTISKKVQKNSSQREIKVK